MTTYFFCAMHQAPGTVSLAYLSGTIATTSDPATEKGLDDITAVIAGKFNPPAETKRLVLTAFNRL